MVVMLSWAGGLDIFVDNLLDDAPQALRGSLALALEALAWVKSSVDSQGANTKYFGDRVPHT
jgi:hypothetical protein